MLKKVPMAILSNKAEHFTKEICKFLLKKWDFICMRGGREGVLLKPNPLAAENIIQMRGGREGVLLKPNPLAAENIIQCFHQIDPCIADNIAFIGDVNIDMQTALSAGITPLAVLWRFRSRDQLRKSGADHFIRFPSNY